MIGGVSGRHNEVPVSDEEREGDVRLIENDYWWKTLVLDCPADATDVTARVRVRQPQGYVQEMIVEDVELRDGQAHVSILYPLVDEGRYDAKPGMWEGAWLMGEYRFDVELMADGTVLAADSLTLDPHSFFPSDRMVISVDARPQIIECAPRQALYQDEDTVRFVFRIRRRRVTKCHVEVDVTRRGGTAPLAGPWRYTLTHDLQEQSFSTEGWDDGRVLDSDPPAGGRSAGWSVLRAEVLEASVPGAGAGGSAGTGRLPRGAGGRLLFRGGQRHSVRPRRAGEAPRPAAGVAHAGARGGDALHRLAGLERRRRPV